MNKYFFGDIKSDLKHYSYSDVFFREQIMKEIRPESNRFLSILSKYGCKKQFISCYKQTDNGEILSLTKTYRKKKNEILIKKIVDCMLENDSKIGGFLDFDIENLEIEYFKVDFREEKATAVYYYTKINEKKFLTEVYG